MAHTLDTNALIAAGTGNPVTGSFTCGAGATLLIVRLAYANGTRTGDPTYNGVALTQADQTRKAASGAEACAEIWYLLGPPTGSSYTVSVPNPNGLSLEACVDSYKAQAGYSSMLDVATGGQNNGSTNPSVSVTTVFAGDVIAATIASGADTWAPSAQSGTQLYDTDNGTWGSGHQYFLQVAAGAKAMSWTFGTSDDWGMCVASFREVRTGINVPKAVRADVLTLPQGIVISKAVEVMVLGPAPATSGGRLVGPSCLIGGLLVGNGALVN